MADIIYAGTTSYIQIQEDAIERLDVLAHAVEPLGFSGNIINVNAEIDDKYESIIKSQAYQYIMEHSAYFYAREEDSPVNMPTNYKAHIEKVEIKNIPMYKVYVPITSKRDDKINSIMNAYCDVMTNLFGSDLLTIKSKRAYEYEDFNQAPEQTLVSINR